MIVLLIINIVLINIVNFCNANLSLNKSTHHKNQSKDKKNKSLILIQIKTI